MSVRGVFVSHEHTRVPRVTRDLVYACSHISTVSVHVPTRRPSDLRGLRSRDRGESLAQMSSAAHAALGGPERGCEGGSGPSRGSLDADASRRPPEECQEAALGRREIGACRAQRG